jgi:hypothetical protein
MFDAYQKLIKLTVNNFPDIGGTFIVTKFFIFFARVENFVTALMEKERFLRMWEEWRVD